MKKLFKLVPSIILVIFLLGTLLIPFTIKGQVTLSDQERESIKEEISALATAATESINLLNTEAFMQSYENSEDFLYVKANGSFVGYNGFEYEVNGLFKNVKSLKYVKHDEGFRFITNTHVLYTWVGHYEAVGIKDRSWVVNDVVTTSLIAKINNEWKVIYEHTSTSKPIFEESN